MKNVVFKQNVDFFIKGSSPESITPGPSLTYDAELTNLRQAAEESNMDYLRYPQIEVGLKDNPTFHHGSLAETSLFGIARGAYIHGIHNPQVRKKLTMSQISLGTNPSLADIHIAMAKVDDVGV